MVSLTARAELPHERLIPPPAVAVVMNHRLVIELFAIDDETGWPIRPVTDYLSNNIVHGNFGGHPRLAGIGALKGSTCADIFLAIAEQGGKRTKAGGLENAPSINMVFSLHFANAQH